MNNAQIKQLSIISNYKKAPKGEIILLGDNTIPCIYLLKKGNIKIVEVDDEGNETIKVILKQGSLFGELDLNRDSKIDEYAKVIDR